MVRVTGDGTGIMTMEDAVVVQRLLRELVEDLPDIVDGWSRSGCKDR